MIRDDWIPAFTGMTGWDAGMTGLFQDVVEAAGPEGVEV